MQDCETHLFFLRDALRLYPSQPDRFKQIAAELRVLVCETKNNHPLLLELMEEVGFSCGLVPFREYVENHLAVYLAPYEYTFRDLVLKVAEQLGSSHEDLSVEEPLAKMQNMILGQAQGHMPLIPSRIEFSKSGRLFSFTLSITRTTRGATSGKQRQKTVTRQNNPELEKSNPLFPPVAALTSISHEGELSRGLFDSLPFSELRCGKSRWTAVDIVRASFGR